MDDQARKTRPLPMIALIIGGSITMILLVMCLCAVLYVIPLPFNLPMPHRITYKVTGTASQADVTYDLDNQHNQDTVVLPFERTTIIFGLNYTTKLDVHSDDGTVSCEILLDGMSMVQATGSTTATCTGTSTGNASQFSSYGD